MFNLHWRGTCHLPEKEENDLSSSVIKYQPISRCTILALTPWHCISAWHAREFKTDMYLENKTENAELKSNIILS